jgi:hypothetical protein
LKDAARWFSINQRRFDMTNVNTKPEEKRQDKKDDMDKDPSKSGGSCGC